MNDITIQIINFGCAAVMLLMLVLLGAATRMKGGAGWAAVILTTSTIPAYMSNLMRDLGAEDLYLIYIYLMPLNLLCFPATWFFARRQLDKSFRLTAKNLLHAIPIIISLVAAIVYYAPMTLAEVGADMAFMESGGESLPAIVNDILLFGQFFAYFAAIFIWCRRRLKFLRDNYSDSDMTEVKWTTNFLVAFFFLFLAAFVGYMIDPRVDIWLFPILTTVCMIYLVYIVLYHSTSVYLNRLPEVTVAAAGTVSKSESATSAMDEEQMKRISDKAVEYLQTSKSYLDPELTLSMLSAATKIAQRSLSAAINGYLHKNFFDLVNEMRVGEAKRILRELSGELTTESIYPQCGFSSARSFFRAFQKFEGASPDNWRKSHREF